MPTTISVTESLVPSPFTITDNPNPLSQSGVSHPPVHRTITPPPYPYTPTPSTKILGSPTSTKSSSPFPTTVVVSSGSPKPTCVIGCGAWCDPLDLFCHPGCLTFGRCGGYGGGGGSGGGGDPDTCDPLDASCGGTAPDDDGNGSLITCSTLQTASICTVFVRSFTTSGTKSTTTKVSVSISSNCDSQLVVGLIWRRSTE